MGASETNPEIGNEKDEADRSYRQVLQLRTGCQVALWAGIVFFSALVVAAPRFSTLLVRLFNDPFAGQKAYQAVEPLYLMTGSLLIVWALIELLLVVRRLPSKVISVACASGIRRSAIAFLLIAVLELIRSFSYPTLQTAIIALVSVLLCILGLALAAWVRWQAHASIVASVGERQAASHRLRGGSER